METCYTDIIPVLHTSLPPSIGGHLVLNNVSVLSELVTGYCSGKEEPGLFQGKAFFMVQKFL